MKPKPKVGDVLYESPTRNKDAKLIPVQVIKVGRKYFSVCRIGERPEKWRMTEHDIQTWLEKTSGWTSQTILYASEQEYLDEVEFMRIARLMREVFCGYSRLRLSLEQLRRIEAIVKEIKK